MEGTTKTREQIEAPLPLLLQSTLSAASQSLVRMRDKPHWHYPTSSPPPLSTLPPDFQRAERLSPCLTAPSGLLAGILLSCNTLLHLPRSQPTLCQLSVTCRTHNQYFVQFNWSLNRPLTIKSVNQHASVLQLIFNCHSTDNISTSQQINLSTYQPSPGSVHVRCETLLLKHFLRRCIHVTERAVLPTLPTWSYFPYVLLSVHLK